MTSLPVLAVTGLAKEARLAAGPGVVAIGAGGDPQRLRRLLDARDPRACRAVVSIGIAGGLDPALRSGDVPKGDALAVARIAGIQGAKKTPDLVPLCHPLSISGVDVVAEVTDAGVALSATVKTTDRTGVEMEALTAVSVAALEAIADRVEAALQDRPEKEIATAEIGASVMQELKRLDKVAYVRFASVYRHFRDIGEFMTELKDLLNAKE